MGRSLPESQCSHSLWCCVYWAMYDRKPYWSDYWPLLSSWGNTIGYLEPGTCFLPNTMCQECDVAVQPAMWGTTVYRQTTKPLYYGSEMCTVLCAIIHIAFNLPHHTHKLCHQLFIFSSAWTGVPNCSRTTATEVPGGPSAAFVPRRRVREQITLSLFHEGVC